MKVTLYGTAGSLAICRQDRIEHGGNTTSLRIESACIPAGMAVGTDAGTGYYALCRQLLMEGCTKFVTLFTHWHHDHTQGLLLVPPTYMKGIQMELFGPVEKGMGPKEVFETLMAPPFHPVDFIEQKSHFSFTKLEHPAGMVIVFHPQGGKKRVELHEFESLEKSSGYISVGKGRYPIDECLVVRMMKATHPEQTISYRFEERPTGKVFVFLTDHENTDGISMSLRQHLTGAGLLIADAQYDEDTYHNRTAGFGHGTGKYVARLARSCGVKLVGLTHHDPGSSDEKIRQILAEARSEASDDMQLFSCRDFQVIEL